MSCANRLIRDNIACLETADFIHIGYNYLCAPLPVVPCQLLRYDAMYPNTPVRTKFTIRINRGSDWTRREIAVLAGPFVLASDAFVWSSGDANRFSLPCTRSHFVHARMLTGASGRIQGRPRVPTGYQKNRKGLPACASMEGAIFIWTPTLYSVVLSFAFFFFYLLSARFLSLSFSPRTPFVVGFFSRGRRVFRVNPDMFHHRAFRSALYKGSKMALSA